MNTIIPLFSLVYSFHLAYSTVCKNTLSFVQNVSYLLKERCTKLCSPMKWKYRSAAPYIKARAMCEFRDRHHINEYICQRLVSLCSHDNSLPVSNINVQWYQQKLENCAKICPRCQGEHCTFEVDEKAMTFKYHSWFKIYKRFINFGVIN